MGISIHYSGIINPEHIAPLCDELADIVKSLGFNESVFVDDNEKELTGIILIPQSKMESIPFLFDTRGRMHSLGDLIAGWSEEEAILSAAVKTQFSDCADHILLVGLLRYIQRKYIPELTVSDEGGYWEQQDPIELKRRMDFLGDMISGLGSALESAFMDTVVDLSDPDALADFVERVVEGFDGKGE